MVLGAENCTNFDLCDPITQYLFANADNLPCSGEVCDASDTSICCGDKETCADYSCAEGIELVANASIVYCAGVCGEEDSNTCCDIPKASSKASWNFLRIYLIVLAISSLLFFGYKWYNYESTESSASSSSSDYGKDNNEEDRRNINEVEPQSNIIPHTTQSIEVEEEEGAETGRVYLL